MNICIFEDFFITRIHPVNHLRHTSEIICGAVTLIDKIKHYLKPKSITLYSRNYLAEYLREKYPKYRVNEFQKSNCLFINSRAVLTKELAKKISGKNKSAIWFKNDDVIAINASGKILEKVNVIFAENAAVLNDFRNIDIEKYEIKDDIRIINYPSDLVLFQKEEIYNDLKNIFKLKKVYVSPKCKISKQSIIDTSSGPVFIGENTVIEPFCYIKGPVYIGRNCIIKSGTTIYGPVTIGDYCKVSGEITNSTLHSYVNKQHLGFLGHSYLCEWVNLGAGTSTSNLKNNYSEIILKIGSNSINTKSSFLGSIIGDHTKTGINTMLNTGTLAGISCNMFGNGYHNKIIKSFSWADASSDSNVIYELEKALHTSKVSMNRRGAEMSNAYEKMFKFVYNNRDNIDI